MIPPSAPEKEEEGGEGGKWSRRMRRGIIDRMYVFGSTGTGTGTGESDATPWLT